MKGLDAKEEKKEGDQGKKKEKNQTSGRGGV